MASSLARRGKFLAVFCAILVGAAVIAAGIYTAFWYELPEPKEKEQKAVIGKQEEQRLERGLNSDDPNLQVLVIADAGQDHRKKFLDTKQPMLEAGSKVDVDPTIKAGNTRNRELRATVTAPGQTAKQYALHLILEGDAWNIHYTEEVK